MDALRLMTFNVQCLPLIAGVLDGSISIPGALVGLFPGTDDDAIDRATAICADLLAIAPDERPHVIALNEAFNEDARGIFLDQLKPTWPNIVEAVYEADLEEDAGLMVFSSLPFHTLPDGSTHMAQFYSDDAGDDSWASKAAVLVQVGLPAEVTTLVFTHLQAAYDSDDQYRDVRARQLEELLKLIDRGVGDDRDQWRNVVVAGDLNIRGDAGSASDEWYETFTGAGEFGQRFADSWIQQRPPGVQENLDPGLSHRDRATQGEQRLDYVCCLKRSDGEAIVAHQMRLGHRTVSDHYALEALIQFEADRCQPCRAVNLDELSPMAGAPVAGQPVGSLAWHVDVTIPADDGRFWLWLPRPGTFSFFAATDLAYQVFAATDLSHPLELFSTLKAGEVPASVQVAVQEFRGQLDPDGGTFVHRQPMLICVRSASGDPVRHRPFMVFEHRGDTPQTALALPPHFDLDLPFPLNEYLGADDQVWLRVKPRATLMGTTRSESIVLTQGQADAARMTQYDRALTALADWYGSGELSFSFDATDDDEFYVTVKRDDPSQIRQVIRWNTPVCYLRLDKGMQVHVDDETGKDWPGADEPELDLSIDGTHLTHVTWDDADTGEDWPGFTDAIRNAVVARGWTSASVGLCQGLEVTIEDPDGIPVAHGVTSWPLNGMHPGEPAEVKRITKVTVFDGWKDGTYSVVCTLTRDA